MVKEFLSDFTIIAKPRYQPDTFKPYFSVILTVISFTILLYSLQQMTLTMHAYADNPKTFSDTVTSMASPEKSCKNFSQQTLSYICGDEIQTPNYSLIPSSSLEQDLHNAAN